MRLAYRHIVPATLSLALFGFAPAAAHAALIPYTYDYDQAAMTASGTTFYSGNNGSPNHIADSYSSETVLNDGVFGTSEALPATAWNEGNFELYENSGSLKISQPALTLNFANSFDITQLVVSYAVRQDSGVHAPSSLTITDGVHSTTYTGFNDSTYTVGGGEARLATIDLTGLGLTGSSLHLSFSGNGQYVGLSEITASGDTIITIPEPAAAGLLGTGVLGLAALRRRKA